MLCFFFYPIAQCTHFPSNNGKKYSFLIWLWRPRWKKAVNGVHSKEAKKLVGKSSDWGRLLLLLLLLLLLSPAVTQEWGGGRAWMGSERCQLRKDERLWREEENWRKGPWLRFSSPVFLRPRWEEERGKGKSQYSSFSSLIPIVLPIPFFLLSWRCNLHFNFGESGWRR